MLSLRHARSTKQMMTKGQLLQFNKSVRSLVNKASVTRRLPAISHSSRARHALTQSMKISIDARCSSLSQFRKIMKTEKSQKASMS